MFSFSGTSIKTKLATAAVVAVGAFAIPAAAQATTLEDGLGNPIAVGSTATTTLATGTTLDLEYFNGTSWVTANQCSVADFTVDVTQNSWFAPDQFAEITSASFTCIAPVTANFSSGPWPVVDHGSGSTEIQNVDVTIGGTNYTGNLLDGSGGAPDAGVVQWHNPGTLAACGANGGLVLDHAAHLSSIALADARISGIVCLDPDNNGKRWYQVP